MVCKFLLVFFHLAIEFVCQAINCSIHVTVYRVGEYSRAAYMHGRLRFVLEFFDAQDDVNVGYIVEVALESLHF